MSGRLNNTDIQSGSCWRNLQQAQIDQHAGESGAKALFPDAMLFNQILVPGGNGHGIPHGMAFAPETLDPVYEFCGPQRIQTVPASALVIDMNGELPEECIGTVRSIIKNNATLNNIVVLANNTPEFVQQLDTDLAVTIVSPNGMSAAAYHAIYRQAKHTIFVDTLRSMDAAHTGCLCSMLFSKAFEKSMAYPLWVSCLTESSYCHVFDSSGRQIQSAETQNVPHYMICENDVDELEKLMSIVNGTSTPDMCDGQNSWIDRLPSAPRRVVVSVPCGESVTGPDAVRDRITRVRRKLGKLVQDPYAFFIDSRIGVLQKIARIFSPEQRAG